MPLLKYDGTLATVTAAPAAGLYGTSGTDTLTGSSLSESLWGGEGDRLVGGLGDDTYYVRSDRDVVVELAGEGVDKLTGWMSLSLDGYPNVENVQVSGDNLYAAGNALDNVVEGGAGKEQIYGGGGQDVLVGGAGADTFIVVKGEGNDVVQDFAASEDRVRLKAGFTSFEQVKAALSQVGSDVKLDLGAGDGLIFRNLSVCDLTAANFQLEFDRACLGNATFADEFSGTLSLWDRESNPGGLWRPDYGYQGSQGVGSYTLISNDEKQVYTSPYFRDHAGDFSESPFVSNSDGTLSIWAKPSTNGDIFGYGYTSGLITTKESFSQTYGYFEIRAQLPTAAGAWPAFWMLPADGSWPPELDIMEVLTRDDNATWTTAHSNATGSHTSQGQMNYTPDTGDGFHTYGVLWSPTTLTWYVDNVEVFSTATPADMNKPMYMLANMAVGGWGGAVEAGALPAEFKIDYIRAYALPGTAPPQSPVPPPPSGPGYHNSLFTLPDSEAPLLTFTGGKKPDTLTGTNGADKLDGQAGSDVMRGGAGDDTYVVDKAQDSVVESAGGGVDTVLSQSGSYVLPAEVDNLRLVGNFGQTGIGNGLANRLVSNDAGSTLQGGGGNDILVAGRGGDMLTGGAGADIFQFDKVPLRTAHVTDFTRGSDMLDLRGLFTGAGYAGPDPIADARLILKATTAGMEVWFDADGTSAGAAKLVVVLDGVGTPSLSAQNDWFFV